MDDLNVGVEKQVNINAELRQKENKFLAGTILILISAASFGLMAIFAKYAYMAKLNMLTILSLRFFIAALIMWVVIFMSKKSPLLEKKQLFALLGLGALGYGLMSSFFFLTVKLIPASIASILLYTYPAIVTILSSYIYKEKITGRKLTALMISSVGLIMVVGIAFAGLNALGIFYGIMSAVVYALYIVASNKFVGKIDPVICTTYIISSAAVVFNVFGWISGSVNLNINSTGWMAIAGISLISSVVAILTFLQGLRLVGPSKASIISTMEPVITILAAFILFSEKLGLIQIVGATLVISAVILIQKDN